MKREGFIPLLQIILLLVVAITAIKLQSPPNVIGRSGPLDKFSAERAMDHLEVIAAKPHPGGTPAHQDVQNYIVNYCRDNGLSVEIQDTMAYHIRGHSISASHVSNIMAILPGKKAGKHILVLSHYDSQPNTPGAADDGAGISAMLETIRALKNRDSLNHPVVFLFTDQEEVGLLGAEAFVNTDTTVKNTGVLMNFESRGNRGPAFTFEVNQQNGWIIKQFAKGAPTPIANSLAYEIYRIMPNDSDFSEFRRENYTGLNQANVYGFVNYHSMTDDIGRIDPRIIQHHGENLLGMINHLDGLNLEDTKAPDLNFFNPVGKWLIHYPVKLNLPLIGIALILAFLFFYLNRDIVGFNLKQILLGIVSILAATIISLAILFLLVKLIIWLYPHYTNFYGNNFYNAPNYFFMFSGITLISFGIVYNRWTKSINDLAQFGAVIIICLLLMGICFFLLPTATYVFYYPLICLLLVLNAKLLFPNNISPLWYLTAGMIPWVLLWAPIVYVLFIVFTLVIPYGAVFLLCLLTGLLIPIWRTAPFDRNNMIWIGLSIIALGFVMGHFTSKPTLDRPLQSNLSYILEEDSGQAKWISMNKFQDTWTENYVDTKEEKFSLYNNWYNWPVWTGNAELHQWDSLLTEHNIIALDDSTFLHQFHFIPDSTTIGLEFLINDLETNDTLILDGRPVPFTLKNGENHRITLHAIDRDGLFMQLSSPQQTGFSIKLIERKLRIPESWLRIPSPLNHIPGPGNYSDAIFRTKTYVF